MQDVKGRKAVLVLASGMDTFSRMTLDQTMKRIKDTDATIFTIGVGEQLFLQADATGGLGPVGQLNFLQAENQMKTFAAMTGGRAWFPRFDGEIPRIMQDPPRACATNTVWPTHHPTRSSTASTAR